MKCKICRTERDNLTGDICVDCLADKMAEIFDQSPHRSITMIRFIDLREQDTPGRFTFFDTITDRFEVINGESVWNTFSEVETDIKSECHLIDCSDKIERRRNLCPDWAFGIAGMMIENVQDRCTEFRCDRMVPRYVLMSTETRTALTKELGVYMDIEQFNVCGLEVVVHNAIEYGNVKVVGEPWVK